MGVMDDYIKRRESGKINDASSSLGRGNETLDERLSRLKKSKATFNVDDDYLKSFQEDYNNYINRVSSGELEDNGSWSELNQKQRYLKAYLNSKASDMESTDYDSFNNYLNSVDSTSRSAYDYAYNLLKQNAEITALKNGSAETKYQTKTDDFNAIENRYYGFHRDADNNYYFVNDETGERVTSEEFSQIDKEYQEKLKEYNLYKRSEGKTAEYQKYPYQDDFAELSSKRDFVNPTKDDFDQYQSRMDGGITYDANNVARDIYGEVIDGNYYERYKAPQVVDKLGLFKSLTDEEVQETYNLNSGTASEWEKAIKEGVDNSWNELYDGEIEVYYYLLNKEGQESANEYLENMSIILNQREEIKRQETIEKGKIYEKIAYNIASVPASVYGGSVGFADDVIRMATGKERNPYSKAHSLSNFASTTRGITANDIDTWANGLNIGGFGFGDFYHSLMSSLDSFLGATSIGKGYTTLMGLGAAQTEAKRLYEDGASEMQIINGSFFSGVAEALFEYVSLDHFLKTGTATTKRQIIKQALKQGGVEATEEMFTEIANTIIDAFNRGTQSEWQQRLENGDFWSALGESIQEVLKAGAGGFFSGLGMSGIGSTASYINYNMENTETGAWIYDQGDTQSIINKGKELGLDTKKAQAVADDARIYELYKRGNSENKNDKLSRREIRELKKAMRQIGETAYNVDAKIKETALKAEIKNRLSEGGKTVTDAEVEKVYKNLTSDADIKITDDATERMVSKLTGTKEDIQSLEDSVNYRVATEQFSMVADKALKNAYSSGKKVQRFDAVNQVADEKTSESGKLTVNGTESDAQIESIQSIGKNDMQLKLSDGTIVSSSDISYASRDEAMMYELVNASNIDAESANQIIKMAKESGTDNIANFIFGAEEAYTYGKYNYPIKDIKTNNYIDNLTTEQKMLAYDYGKNYAKSESEKNQAKVNENKTDKVTHTGEVKYLFSKGDNVVLTNRQKQSIGMISKLVSEVTHNEVKIFASEKVDGKMVLSHDFDSYEKQYKKGDIAPNGFFEPQTGTIYLDINAGNSGEGVMLWTIAHEFTHFIKQYSPEKFKALADFLINEYGELGEDIDYYIDRQIEKAKSVGQTLSRDKALEEVVADSMEQMLTDTNVAEKIARLKASEPKLVDKMKQFFSNLLKAIKAAYAKLKPQSEEALVLKKMQNRIETITDLFAEALVDAGNTYQVTGIDNIINDVAVDTTDTVNLSDMVKNSYRSFAEACGFMAMEDENGIRYWLFNGKKVSEITNDDIKNSPIGALISYSRDQKFISESDYERQIQMFTDIANMCVKQQDFAQAMQFVGSAIFTGMKANADKQYGTSYDFPSICTKTQAVIDKMSAEMVRLERGLTKEEIEKIYRKVWEMGNPVPCPECYVFSRWIGIGGLLDNIKKYQDKYSAMTVEEVEKSYQTMKNEIEKYAKENKLTFGKAKGKLASKFTSEYNKLSDEISKANEKGEKVSQSKIDKLAKIESQMDTVKAMTWIDTVYFKDSAHKSVNKNYIVPSEILFNLNLGEEFATKYKEAWAFRTTQGAGYGKAITPYAEAVLGEGILVTNNTTKTIKAKQNRKNIDERQSNIFLEQKGTLNKDAIKKLETARRKQLTQAFMGGQRIQSTSDARYENFLDYLIAAVEIQAMHGMAQVYTKVSGAVPIFDAWGMSSNQSLMPLNNGFDKHGRLSDTLTGGMKPEVAFENRKKYETSGTITIGVNDKHIRALFDMLERDFVIPYHASGGDRALIDEFRRIQDQSIKNSSSVHSTDYSKVQGEKLISYDLLSRMGYTDEQIKDVAKFREQRLALLTGKGNIDLDYINKKGNEILKKLYDELRTKGGKWYGIALTKGKCESQIYPNEYWDTSLTYEESGKITEDYLEYCRRLGMLQKFSGQTIRYNKKLGYSEFVPVTGYDENGNKVNLTNLAYKGGDAKNGIEPFFWKSLTDRRMYGNDGRYLEQRFVTLGDADPSIALTFAKNNQGSSREYSKEISDKTIEQSMFSTRVTNKDIVLSDGEYALYIKNTQKANYIDMILNGTKTVETRASKTLDEFVGKEMPITDGKYVYGYVTLGDAYEISAKDFHNKSNQLKHRVPVGDTYDVKDGEKKWAYPIESYRKIEKQKLSDSKDYKYSYQAREVKYSNRGNGYLGYSMSNNAVEAYENGEKPLSKWSKADILNAVKEIDAEKAESLSKVKLKTLKDVLLKKTSWHHTSEYYNRTDFYSVDEDAVNRLNKNEIVSLATHKDTKAIGNEFRGDFTYIEWSGTKNRPKANKVSLKDVNIEERGSFYYVTDDDGTLLAKKKIGSNGTYATDYAFEEKMSKEKEERISKWKEEVKASSSQEAYELFSDLIDNGYSQSNSGNIYKPGRKPTSYDVYEGLDKFFKKGEQRLSPNEKNGYNIETWNGTDWESTNDVKYSPRETKDSVEFTDRILYGTQYSGAGLVSEGLQYKLLKQEFAVEWDDKIAAIHASNHDAKVYAGKRDGNALNFDANKKAKNLFYMHFSPVCHNFSKAKHNRVESPLDIESAKKVAKDIADTMLPLYTVENAPEYATSQSAKIIKDQLTKLGYKYRAEIYNAADYGSATSRERYILVAVKGDLELPDMPNKQARTNSWDKVTRKYWDNLENAKARNGNAIADFMVDAIKNTKKLQKYINDDGTMSIDKPLLIITTNNGHEVTFAEYGKLCPTLTTKCREGKLILPGEHISLVKPNKNVKQVSPEFMGAIMDIDREFDFGAANTRAFTVIGNGVPIKLVKAVIGGSIESVYRQTHDGQTLYSNRDYAPTFYSQMSKVIDGIKPAKMGATGVVPYLKGKGVKAEELKWSGIEAFLEGKKSVTKEDLQEFAKGSMLEIEEKVFSANAEAAFEEFRNNVEYYYNFSEAEYEYFFDYDGGFSYELYETYIERLEEDNVIDDNKFDVLLMEGRAFANQYENGTVNWAEYKTLGGTNYREILFKIPDATYINFAMQTHWGEGGVLAHARIQDMILEDGNRMLLIEEIQSDWHNAGNKFGYKNNPKYELLDDSENKRFVLLVDGKETLSRPKHFYKEVTGAFWEDTNEYDTKQALIDLTRSYEIQHPTDQAPDAPLKNYTDYVMKRLLRMAAEEGYDYIGWTTGQMQENRWSSDYAEGYQIEYDQDIPKFMNKFGKKWDTKVSYEILPETGDVVHSFEITDEMKDSVLYEGQPMYSNRNQDSLDTRTLLANALETTAQDDTERELIAQYKEKIELINKRIFELNSTNMMIEELDGKDPERVEELKAKAEKIADRITYYDKQLLRLESASSLKNVVKRERQKAYKMAYAKAKERGKEYHQQSVQKMRERREKYEYRTKLKNMLEDVRIRLQNPTPGRTAPASLVTYLAEVYEMLNPTGVNQDTKTAQRYYATRDALNELKRRYDNLKAEGVDYEYSSEWDETISEQVNNLANVVGDTAIRDMTREQIEDVYNIMHDILFTVRNANTLIRDNAREEVQDIGGRVIVDQMRIQRKGLNKVTDNEKLKVLNKISNGFREWTLNPMRAVREMSGFKEDAELVKLFDDLNDGLITMDRFDMENRKRFDALRDTEETKKYFTDAVEKKIDIGLKTVDEKPALLTKMQIIQALLTINRERANPNRTHLKVPVRFVDNDYLIKGQKTEAFDNAYIVMVDDEFERIAKENLSEWDMAYMKAARDFFNIYAKKAIDEVSLATKNRLTATENEYIPYTVDADFLAKDSENLKYDATIGGMGMLKSVKQFSVKPLVMWGLNSVIDKHIRDVGKVYGLTIPIKNWNKIFNYTDAEMGTSVKEQLRDVWGEKGRNTLENAVADLQSSRPGSNNELISKIKNAFVVSTLASNLSVWMKQFASYPTAGAILSRTSLLKGAANYTQIKDKSTLWEEIDEHTPLHYLRRKGLSLQELGDLSQSTGWENRLNEKLGKYSPMNWIQSMDVMTTSMLWVASKADVEERGIYVTDDNYWDEVTKTYEKVLSDTQPMYDTLHRAEITKDNNFKNFIMFQTQPIQNSGILRESSYRLGMAIKEYGKNSNEAKKASEEFKKAVFSQLASHLAFTLMTLIAAMAMHKMNPYRDEDKELTPSSVGIEYLSGFTKNFIGAIVPVVGNYSISIFEKITGKSNYDVFSAPIIDKINSSIDTFSKITDPSIENYTKMATDVLSYFGIPAGNVVNILNGARLHAEDLMNGQFGSFEAGVERTNKQNVSRAFKASESGDSKKMKSIIDELIASYQDKGKTEKEAKSSVKSSVTNYVKEEFLKAYNSKDTEAMTKYRKFMSATGLYEDVVSTTQDWIKNQKK